MTGSTVPASRWLPAGTTRRALLLRALVLTSPLAAIVCTWLAADRTVPALDVAVVALAIVCTALPDSHAGLPVIAVVGAEWWATVDDPVTPWSLAVAVALAVFHVSMAAATVAPLAATWTPAMSTRWVRRTAAVGVATSVVWAGIAVIGDHRVPGNSLLLAAALIALAFAALWARNESIARP